MKKIVPILLMMVLLWGCAGMASENQKQYSATFLTLFDTVTTILGPGETEEDFRQQAQRIHDELLVYHQLFDIYKEYDGLTNLKTINDQAGISPVTVDPAIIELLLDCKDYYELTDGKVNVAMGSVLKLWHDARSAGLHDPANAQLPQVQKLMEAANHMDFDNVIIDEAASTVYITDPEMSLDVGAIAKGWAAQKVSEGAPRGMLISVGGNVCATGPKDSQGTPWVIGIQDPDKADENLHTIYVTGGSVVTSGDYQRAYWVDGEQYHHIIDPETLMPSTLWSSVTVVSQDSALADALSTTLFLLPLEEGRALAEACGVQVLWVDGAGQEYMTSGFENMIRT